MDQSKREKIINLIKSGIDKNDLSKECEEMTSIELDEVRILITELKNHRKYSNNFHEYINWIKEHQDKETGEYKIPRSIIYKNGKYLKQNEMTKEERKEVRLGGWWSRNPRERIIIENYKRTEINNIPLEEYRDIVIEYNKTIENNAFERWIEWVRNHINKETGEYKIPRSIIYKNGKYLNRNEMTKEERNEVILGRWWNQNPIERTIIEQYKETKIEKIPEEYREIVNKYRDIIKDKKIYRKTRFYEYIAWIEKNTDEKTRKYKLPRQAIREDGIKLKTNEMTEEELEEVRLGRWWKQNPIERIIIELYKETEIENIPEEYRNIVSIYRDVTNNKLIYRKITFNEYIEWIENHQDKETGKYKRPRVHIVKNGRKLKTEEMTEEELEEHRLGVWWTQNPKERNIIEQYKETEIENIPEEYKEIVVIVRKVGIKPKRKIIQQVRQCVRDNVETNNETRNELSNIVIEYTQDEITEDKKQEILELIKTGFPKDLIAFEYKLKIEDIEKYAKEIEEERDR